MSDARDRIIADLHPDIVVGEHDNFVLRVFDFPLSELEELDKQGALIATVHSGPGVENLKKHLTETELLSVRAVIAKIQSQRKPTHRDEPIAKRRGYDVISVIRFSCGAFDVRSVDW